jgi:hypothetical protein
MGSTAFFANRSSILPNGNALSRSPEVGAFPLRHDSWYLVQLTIVRGGGSFSPHRLGDFRLTNPLGIIYNRKMPLPGSRNRGQKEWGMNRILISSAAILSCCISGCSGVRQTVQDTQTATIIASAGGVPGAAVVGIAADAVDLGIILTNFFKDINKPKVKKYLQS